MKNELSKLITIIITLSTLFGAIYGFTAFIDWRIREVIDNTEFIKKASRIIRPFAIFNEKEQILVDSGAMEYIDDIEIESKTEGGILLPQKITIHPKIHLDNAPLLIALDTDMSTIEAKRGKKYDWVYSIKYHGYNEKPERKFSVEVIK